MKILLYRLQKHLDTSLPINFTRTWSDRLRIDELTTKQRSHKSKSPSKRFLPFTPQCTISGSVKAKISMFSADGKGDFFEDKKENKVSGVTHLNGLVVLYYMSYKALLTHVVRKTKIILVE